MVGWSYLNDERERRDRPSQGLRLELARVGSKAMRLEAASPMGDGLSHQTLQRMGEQKYHEASLGCEAEGGAQCGRQGGTPGRSALWPKRSQGVGKVCLVKVGASESHPRRHVHTSRFSFWRLAEALSFATCSHPTPTLTLHWNPPAPEALASWLLIKDRFRIFRLDNSGILTLALC